MRGRTQGWVIGLALALALGLAGCEAERATTDTGGADAAAEVGADVVVAPDVPLEVAPDGAPDVPDDTAPDLPPVCEGVADCEGLPHDDCEGWWTCPEGQCVYVCDQTCDSPPAFSDECAEVPDFQCGFMAECVDERPPQGRFWLSVMFGADLSIGALQSSRTSIA